MNEEEEDQLMLDLFKKLDEEILQIKAFLAFAELCRRKCHEAWSVFQEVRASNASDRH